MFSFSPIFFDMPRSAVLTCLSKAHQRWNATRAPRKYVPGQRDWRLAQGKRLHYKKEEGMPADGWVVIESERDCQPGSVRNMSLLKRIRNWAKRYPEKKEQFLTCVNLSAPPSASSGFWHFSTGDWVTWLPTYSRRLSIFLSSFLSRLFSLLIHAYKARTSGGRIAKPNLSLVHVTVLMAVVEFIFPFPDVRWALHVD